MPSTQTRVAGVSFRPDYPGYFHQLAQRDPSRYPKCRLTRDPGNSDDPNAVKVIVGRKHVGFVPRDLAVRVAEVIDSGIEVVARVVSVDVWEDLPASPSMTIEIIRPPTKET